MDPTCYPLSQEFAKARNPMVIVGSVVLQRADAEAIHATAMAVASNVAKPSSPDWRTFNVLHRVR